MTGMTFLLSAPEAILRDLCPETQQLSLDAGPSWGVPLPPLEGEQESAASTKIRTPETAASGASSETLLVQWKALEAIRIYRDLGHYIAQLDPLGLQIRNLPAGIEFPHFSPEEREQTILFGDFKGQKIAPVLERLKRAYGGTLTLEVAHLDNMAQKTWLRNIFEKEEGLAKTITPDVQQLIFEGLVAAEGFERFLATKFPGAKRFGLEGGESFIPGLSQGLIKAQSLGVQQIVLGMAHRGRLNVMANVFQVPFAWFLKYFRGHVTEETSRAGDVKYHMGAEAPSMTLLPNPSHLESVDPVVLGVVKAKQETLKSEPATVLGVLIHGDASFMGQGIVAESLSLAHLKGYETGGTLHVILNNQVGFTANPDETRSSLYASDIAKGYGIPILHVNGDDPEAVLRAFWIAVSFRQQFAQDILIDLVCYRRNGHNETDEPAFTQPHMYDVIHTHPSIRDSYRQKLLSQKILTAEKVAEIQDAYHEKLAQIFDKTPADEPTAALSTPVSPPEISPPTGISLEKLRDIGCTLATVPENFHLHPKLKRLMDNRLAMAEGTAPLDWSMAEALAFGTLLSEGTNIRLSGQDSVRGTFTQRHAVLIDQEDQTDYIPLNTLSETAQVTLLNSPLSEMGVMGFEFGYSQESQTTLVLWEAQFGDFANGAQIIIDQYIASSETKWDTTSGLVLLLPHAYEGQGAEHSSARLERFLQLAAEDNIQVANCSTPANYFHILRRQIKKSSPKPLILMTPKSLLRHKAAVSSLEDLGPTTTFQPVLEDLMVPKTAAQQVQRVVLCSGKVYYDLLAARTGTNLTIPLIRLEEIYPFPKKQLTEALAPYASPNTVLVWAQEEAQNNGAWSFLENPLKSVAKGLIYKEVVYVGRRETAAPATGHSTTHTQEQTALVKSALGI